jgi:hypothetical protein
VAVGAAGMVLQVGCGVPSSLASSVGNLPEPDLSDLPLPDLAITGPPTPTVAVSSGELTPVPAAPAPSQSAPTVPGLVVGKTGGDGVYLRSSIKPEKKVKVWPDGTPMALVGEDRTVDGKLWRNVRDPAGNVGWVPAQYLVESSASGPTPAAAATRDAAGAAPARWNLVDLDAFANGNVPLAAEQLRALGVGEIRGRAQKVEGGVVLRNLPRYYGTIVRLEGYVGEVRQAPADSPLARLLGFGVLQAVVSCRDGTIVDLFHLGTAAELRIGDLVVAFGLPAGQSSVENRLAGPTTRLAVVSKLVEKVPD